MQTTSDDLPFDDVLNTVSTTKTGDSKNVDSDYYSFDESELFGGDVDSLLESNLHNPDSPWDRYEKKQRIKILALSALPMILQPLSTTMIVPTFNNIADDLDTLYAIVMITVVGYNLFAGIFPMFYGPIGDTFGRKIIWYITLPAFAVFAAICGFAVDIWLLIALRSILGAFACASVIVGAGIVTDVFPPDMQGKALGLQQLPALLSPILGYPLGGLLDYFFGWRSVNFFLAIGSIPITMIVFLLLPETLAKGSTKQFSGKALLVAINPWRTIKLLLRPIIGLVAIARAFGYASMMLLVLLNTNILTESHNLTAMQIGFWNLPFGIGTIFGSVLGGVFVDRQLAKYGRGGRLISANFSTFVICLGLIGYGWTVQMNLWLGMLFSTLVGFGATANRPGYLSYAMQEIPEQSAAITGSTMFLSMFLTLPLSIVGASLQIWIGVPSLFTCCAIITLVATFPAIVIMGLNITKNPDLE